MITVTFTFADRDITFEDIEGTPQNFLENVNLHITRNKGYMYFGQKRAKYIINLNQVQSIEFSEQIDE